MCLTCVVRYIQSVYSPGLAGLPLRPMQSFCHHHHHHPKASMLFRMASWVGGWSRVPRRNPSLRQADWLLLLHKGEKGGGRAFGRRPS